MSNGSSRSPTNSLHYFIFSMATRKHNHPSHKFMGKLSKTKRRQLRKEAKIHEFPIEQFPKAVKGPMRRAEFRGATAAWEKKHAASKEEPYTEQIKRAMEDPWNPLDKDRKAADLEVRKIMKRGEHLTEVEAKLTRPSSPVPMNRVLEAALSVGHFKSQKEKKTQIHNLEREAECLAMTLHYLKEDPATNKTVLEDQQKRIQANQELIRRAEQTNVDGLKQSTGEFEEAKAALAENEKKLKENQEQIKQAIQAKIDDLEKKQPALPESLREVLTGLDSNLNALKTTLETTVTQLGERMKLQETWKKDADYKFAKLLSVGRETDASIHELIVTSGKTDARLNEIAENVTRLREKDFKSQGEKIKKLQEGLENVSDYVDLDMGGITPKVHIPEQCDLCGKVECVCISVFNNPVKGRPWTPSHPPVDEDTGIVDKCFRCEKSFAVCTCEEPVVVTFTK